MDSITQATLGAMCGELVLGRRIGNRGILWGLLLGTLPDLDVLAFPWLDSVEELAWHRGLSHSALLCVAGGVVLGLLVHRVHRDAVSRRRACGFAFLALATHVLIDCFTVYGTQVLEPFSSRRIGWNNLFIIDPLFTLPMVAAILVVPWLHRASAARRRIAAIGIGLSSLYVVASFGLKAVADARFARAIEAQGFAARRWMSAPMPLTTLYWRCVVDAGDRFLIGHTAILDGPDDAIRWREVPRQAGLVAPLRGTRAFEMVRWFSNGYWAAREVDGALVVSDLRFGSTHLGRVPARGAPPGWLFDFVLTQDGAGLQMTRAEIGDVDAALRHVARRALGLR